MILDTDESIVAIATPRGRGAISTIRLSGPRAFEVVKKQLQIRGKNPAARTARLGRLLDLQGHFLDEVIFIFFPGPNSYTGQDLVEISCHGSPVVTQNIVNTFLGMGVRLAEPGEFTLRAVLHGRIDLLQAEAIQDLIESKTELQARWAGKQLLGQLSHVLSSVRQEILEVVCQLETGIEFAEEDLNLAPQEELLERLRNVDRELRNLEGSFEEGRIVHDGIEVVLSGKPNVGKSSIFNRLSGSGDAIVTAVPGTTRDALKEMIAIMGIPVRLVDTAGIRDEQACTVEHLGVERSLAYLKGADLVLFVVDHSVAYSEEDERIWREIYDKPYLLLINKIDLPKELNLPRKIVAHSTGRVKLSALHNRNIDELRRKIGVHAFPGRTADHERPTLSRLRHKHCIEKVRKELGIAMSEYEAGGGEELVLYSLRRSLGALGELTGEVTTEEILAEIFASFCVGK